VNRTHRGAISPTTTHPRPALTDVLTVIVAVAVLGVLIRTRLNSAWLIGAGVVIGVLHNVAL
jgi:1,4-dihydroxy-2-naphthoate octaprenyltransferase